MFPAQQQAHRVLAMRLLRSNYADVKPTSRLLAGGAGIHVDFHTDGHFDDLWGLPGHFGSPCKRGPTDNLTPNEKFVSKI
jgi:hypothetical protein